MLADKSPFGVVPVFRPTLEEFIDFSGYVAKIWATGEPCGLARIIPPEGWAPTRLPYNTKDLTIPSPIKQVLNGKQGKFGVYTV
jgi:jumonji domain-containing protein 2